MTGSAFAATAAGDAVGAAAGEAAGDEATGAAAGFGGAAGLGGAGFSGLMPRSQEGPEYMSAANPFPFHFSSKSAAALFGVSPGPHNFIPRIHAWTDLTTGFRAPQIEGNRVSPIGPEIDVHRPDIFEQSGHSTSKRNCMMP